MSVTADSSYFFQTDSSLTESARKSQKKKNNSGSPFQTGSKILGLALDPHESNQILLAEATGVVRRFSINTKTTLGQYVGPKAPLGCVAVSRSRPSLVFAGCWDKCIWSWDAQSYKPNRTYVGHGDFVKTVLVATVNNRELLVSGGADATIIVWNAMTGDKLHINKSHTRGVLALTIDPFSYPSGPDGSVPDGGNDSTGLTLFSADSSKDIRTWNLTADTFTERTEPRNYPIVAHETSVNSLCFDEDGDLWTASADKSAKCLSRERKWQADTILAHPDFVRDIVVDGVGGWIATACRDEEVRVWEKSSGELYHVYSGHYEEVTGLLLLPDQKLISASIDGTIRQWSLKMDDLRRSQEEKIRQTSNDVVVPAKKASLLTLEEEQELADLMDSD